MTDKENIHNMSRLAMLESGESREVIRLCRFKRIDYCIVQAVKGCVAGTVCFAAAVGLWICYIWDDVNVFFADAQYMDFLMKLLGLYCMFMVVYLVICVVVALYRHKKCRKKRQMYIRYLKNIKRCYAKKDSYRRKALRDAEDE